MTEIKKIAFLMLVLAYVYRGMGQDLGADLKLCYNTYGNLTTLSTRINVEVYKNVSDPVPSLILHGGITKDRQQYFSYFEKNSIICNDKYMVYIDDAAKYIYYKDLNSAKGKGKLFDTPYDPAEVAKSLATILRHHDTIQYNGIVKGSKEYFVKGHSMIYLTALSIDTSTHLISSLTYYYDQRIMKQNNKVVVKFTNTQLHPALPSDMFSEKKFLTIDGEKYTLTPKYKEYSVLKDEPKRK